MTEVDKDQPAPKRGTLRSVALLAASVLGPPLLVTLFPMLPQLGISTAGGLGWAWLGSAVAAGLVAIAWLPWSVELRLAAAFVYLPAMLAGLPIYILGLSCLVLAECI